MEGINIKLDDLNIFTENKSKTIAIKTINHEFYIGTRKLLNEEYEFKNLADYIGQLKEISRI